MDGRMKNPTTSIMVFINVWLKRSPRYPTFNTGTSNSNIPCILTSAAWSFDEFELERKELVAREQENMHIGSAIECAEIATKGSFIRYKARVRPQLHAKTGYKRYNPQLNENVKWTNSQIKIT